MRLPRILTFGHYLPIFVVGFFMAGYATADASVVSPNDFLMLVLQTISNLGGLPWVLKISAIITLVIAAMKVSLLNDLLWSKLGDFKAWAAPILGLLGGILALTASGQPITMASLLAYLSAGAGAIILHELLDTVKSIPGLGDIWVNIINIIQKALGGPTPAP